MAQMSENGDSRPVRAIVTRREVDERDESEAVERAERAAKRAEQIKGQDAPGGQTGDSAASVAKPASVITKRARDLTIWRAVAELHLPIEQVAADAGISPRAVLTIVNRESKALANRLTGDLRLVAAQQTQALHSIAREAVAAFRRSKMPQRSITRPLSQARIDSADENAHPGSLSEDQPGKAWLAGTETISDPKGGEARHLDIALKALADVRRIWGLEAPSKLDIIASVESRPVGERLSQVTAELASLLPGSTANEAERRAVPNESERASESERARSSERDVTRT
jgi:hypothetical protein